MFATDTVLTTLMCAARSVYSWDVVVTRAGAIGWSPQCPCSSNTHIEVQGLGFHTCRCKLACSRHQLIVRCWWLNAQLQLMVEVIYVACEVHASLSVIALGLDTLSAILAQLAPKMPA